MESQFEILWTITETLLDGGREMMARSLFDWSMEWVFLSGLKNAPEPVLITKYGGGPQPLRLSMKARTDKCWGAVVMSYRCNKLLVAKRSFVRALQSYYNYSVAAAEQGANEGGQGMWSVNRWH